MNNIHPVLTGEDEIPALGNHGAHLMVVAVNFADEDSRTVRRHLHQLHARVLRALAEDERVVGYAVEGTTIGPRALRAELADDSRPPLHLWAPAWVWSGEDGITAYTYGLASFGHPEVQIVDADLDTAEAYLLLNDVAGYVVSGVSLEDGAEVGWSAGERFTAAESAWVVDPAHAAWQLNI